MGPWVLHPMLLAMKERNSLFVSKNQGRNICDNTKMTEEDITKISK